MIYLFFGENTYARDQALAELVASREAERIDGLALEVRDLPTIFRGQTLFTRDRMIIIRDASENVPVWDALEQYSEETSAGTTVVLLDHKPDKRTKTYKSLQKHGTVREFTQPRDVPEAIRLTLYEAKKRGLQLDRRLANLVVERVGLDSWDIVHALEKLSVLDEVTPGEVTRIIDANPTEQVFGLFEAALRGDTSRVQTLCSVLALSEEPYRVMGLLATQATQLAALATAGKNRHVAEDLGLKSEYGLKRLRPFAQYMSREHLRAIVTALADADVQMKSSGEDPWALVEQGLIKVSLSQAKYGKHGRSLAGE